MLKFPGRAKYGNITLKHGFTTSEKLWNSFKKTLRGEPERKTLTIIMFDTKGERKRDWTFDRAFPPVAACHVAKILLEVGEVEVLTLALSDQLGHCLFIVAVLPFSRRCIALL